MAARKRSQPRETFGDVVLRAGMTLTEVARKSGVARRTLTYWRDGEFGAQEAKMLKVAAVLGVDPVRLRDAILASGKGR